MIDTLMALWNRGYGGRGVIVAIAFFVICISISLLLITVQGPWAAQVKRPQVTLSQRGPTDGASVTPTRPVSGIQPVADNTVTIYAPTTTATAKATNTAASCATAQATGQTPTQPVPTPSPVIDHPTQIPTRPRPTPTATHTPPPTATPTPAPTSTPTPSPTATATPSPSPTSTPTPSPTATATPSPTPSPTATITPSPTPIITPTVMPSPTASATVTAVSSPTSPIIPFSAQKTPCAQTGVGDSLGASGDSSMGTIIERDMGFVLGGSALGTTLFYLSVYWLTRRKKE